MQQPKYRFYATLLDAFQWYKSSESDESLQELIDKINRVPFTSEAAAKGTAFNELVDLNPEVDGDTVSHNGFDFDSAIVKQFSEYFAPALNQVYASALLPTEKGLVELYGYADEVYADTVYDIKTTGSYEFPKYTHNWQHKVYPYCFNENGIKISNFEYTVTDFKNIYVEQYVYNPDKDVQELQTICVDLITFLENMRHLITDKKVYGAENN